MKKLSLSTLALLALTLLSTACEKHFNEPMVLGGQEVSAAILNQGKEKFMQNCYACHGETGNGKGPASHYMRPVPRDFTHPEAYFKFGGVEAGQLPNDETLTQIIKKGLNGTPMLPWDLADKDIHAIIQYIKTLSPRWQKEKPGKMVVAPKDPWEGNEAAGVEEGKNLYHATVQCARCHPSYVTKQELFDVTKKLLGYEMTEIADNIYDPQLRDSSYGHKLLPIDFTYHPIKTGTEPKRLYQTIAAGIGGTAMPAWSSLTAQDLWALTHYVKSLADIRDTPKALALQKALRSQPPFVAPQPDVENSDAVEN